MPEIEMPETAIRFGRQVCGSRDAASQREWLVTDGVGGFAMGTVGGLRTRRYHGMLIVATEPPIGRRLGLAALDPVLEIGSTRVELAVHDWASGVTAPCGTDHLASFAVIDGVPRWQWCIGPVILQAEIAMLHGRPATGINYRLLSRGSAPVRLIVSALCTWRDVHGERHAEGRPHVETSATGFGFERSFRVEGADFEATGEWYVGVHLREEAARGLNAEEDLWCAGRFVRDLEVGESLDIRAWAGDLEDPPPSAAAIAVEARRRFLEVARSGAASDRLERLLCHAADQFIVNGHNGPTVVAGYPWFGDWSRDTMMSYEGLFLETGRSAEGRELLLAAASTVSEGMLANTADVGMVEYNTVDGTLWFIHAVGRHVERTGDAALSAVLRPVVQSIIDHHVAGTRYGIRVDHDGLITQGQDGLALTWMDARVDGRPITARAGKPVEVNALWLRGLDVATAMGIDVADLAERARASFVKRFVKHDGSLFDVVDGPSGDDASVRPNQLVAAAFGIVAPEPVLDAVAPLITSLGLRSLAPTDPSYLGSHRGSPSDRDHAYHQGTVWPWLIGPLVDASVRAGRQTATLIAIGATHVDEWGLGSVSETADGDAPHHATGCPFQAWSVAELLRAMRVTKSVVT